MATSPSLKEVLSCGSLSIVSAGRNLMLEAPRAPTESVERVGGPGLLLLPLASNRYWTFLRKEDYIEASLDVESPSGVAAPPRNRLLGLLLDLRVGATGSFNLKFRFSFGLGAPAFCSSASCRFCSSSYPWANALPKRKSRYNLSRFSSA